MKHHIPDAGGNAAAHLWQDRLTLPSSLPDWASQALPLSGRAPSQLVSILCLGESGSGPGRLGAGDDVVGGREDLEECEFAWDPGLSGGEEKAARQQEQLRGGGEEGHIGVKGHGEGQPAGNAEMGGERAGTSGRGVRGVREFPRGQFDLKYRPEPGD